MIKRDDVLAARGRINGHIRHALVRTRDANGAALAEVSFSARWCLQTRGAFQPSPRRSGSRRAEPFSRCRRRDGRQCWTGQRYAAAALGIRATVFVPETAPTVKIERIREYGADVQQVGTEYAEALEAAIDYAGIHGSLFNHAYDQLEIAAGVPAPRRGDSRTSRTSKPSSSPWAAEVSTQA